VLQILDILHLLQELHLLQTSQTSQGLQSELGALVSGVKPTIISGREDQIKKHPQIVYRVSQEAQVLQELHLLQELQRLQNRPGTLWIKRVFPRGIRPGVDYSGTGLFISAKIRSRVPNQAAPSSGVKIRR
jgi:hypothetical protein